MLISRLLRGIEVEPSILLDPLEERMRALAEVERFEEAAWLRDRHDALAVALERRRSWRSLAGAGGVRVEDRSGLVTTIDHGVFVDCRPPGDPEGLETSPGYEPPEVPLTVEAAEEAALIWRWLMGNDGVRLIDSTGPLVMPRNRVARLHLERRAA
jgi:hypothetical protein